MKTRAAPERSTPRASSSVSRVSPPCAPAFILSAPPTLPGIPSRNSKPESPAAAAKLIGNRVVQSDSIDIGIAIEAEDGIIVPVIRAADKTSLADLTARYQELIELGRKRRISPEMQTGGIAAVSNFGTFGVEWGTPIPLPDQTMILGLGAGKKVPAWDETKKEFVPETEAQITLSFDHRSLDGGAGGRLLKRMIELLEDPVKL